MGISSAIFERSAPDWQVIDPSGALMTKAQADEALKSGAVKFESVKLDEVTVRVFGDTAVAFVVDTE